MSRQYDEFTWKNRVSLVDKDPDLRAENLQATDKYNHQWTQIPEEFLDQVQDKFGFSIWHIIRFPYYAHVSLADEGKIALYNSVDDLRRGRVIRIKPGKVFRRCIDNSYKDSIVASVTNMYNKYINTPELLWARTADEIEYVYQKGPRSCMGGKEGSEASIISQIHPTRVYATDDLAVAYIERDGKITARALVNEIDDQYNRIYGNDVQLSSLLEEAGYREGNFDGCRVKKLYENGLELMPYMDIGDEYGLYDHDSDHWIVGYCDEEGEADGWPFKCKSCDTVSLHAPTSYNLYKVGRICYNCISSLDLVKTKAGHTIEYIYRTDAIKCDYPKGYYHKEIETKMYAGERFIKGKMIDYGFYVASNGRVMKTEYAHRDCEGEWELLTKDDRAKVMKMEAYAHRRKKVVELAIRIFSFYFDLDHDPCESYEDMRRDIMQELKDYTRWHVDFDNYIDVTNEWMNEFEPILKEIYDQTIKETKSESKQENNANNGNRLHGNSIPF
jgi:hypothetical protein